MQVQYTALLIVVIIIFLFLLSFLEPLEKEKNVENFVYTRHVTISLQVDIGSHIIMSFVHGFVTSSQQE
jgi:hypothetical protein